MSLIDYSVEMLPVLAKRTLANDVEHIATEQFFAAVRTDNNAVLGVHTGQYTIMQNVDLLDTMRGAMDKLGIQAQLKETVVGDGARVYVECKIPNKEIEIPQVGDKLELKFRFQNSFDGRLKCGFSIQFTRLVCKNGMRASDKIFEFASRHSAKLSLESLVTKLENAYAKIEEEVQVFAKMARIPLTQEQGHLAIKNLFKGSGFSTKYQEEIAAVWETPSYVEDRPRNLYNLHNAFTQVITHEVLNGKGKFELADKMSNHTAKRFVRAAQRGNAESLLVLPA